MFCAKVQFPGDGDQVGDLAHAVPVDDFPGHADGVSVVQPHLAQQPQVLPLLDGLIDKVVEGFALRNVAGIQPQEGGQDSAVVAEHQITAGAGPFQFVVVVHLGHLVQDDHL